MIIYRSENRPFIDITEIAELDKAIKHFGNIL